MSSVRNTTPISYPNYVQETDIKENGLLITDSDIQKTLEILKNQPDKRFTKLDLKQLGINSNYSIMKDKKRCFVVYKRNHYLGKGSQGKIKIAQFFGITEESKNQNFDKGKLLALKVCEMKNDDCKYNLEQEYKILHKLGRVHSELIQRSKNDIIKCQFLQELMPGEELFNYLRPPKKPNEKQKLRIIQLNIAITMLANALAEMEFLHSKGILHCDIKIENALYDEKTGKMSFVDMGIALIMNDKGQSKGTCRGSEGLIAPEIKKFWSNTYNEKTEMYALGCFFNDVLYHVDTKQRKQKTYLELKKCAQSMTSHYANDRPTAKKLKSFLQTLLSQTNNQYLPTITESKENKKEFKISNPYADATKWLSDSLNNEFLSQYQKIETGRKKHLNDLKELCADCNSLLSPSKEINSVQRFLAIVNILQYEFNRLKDKWCKPSFFSSNKTAENFIEHLNTNMKGHHYTRMLGIILKNLFESPYAHLLQGNSFSKKLVENLQAAAGYQFTLSDAAPLKPIRQHSKSR